MSNVGRQQSSSRVVVSNFVKPRVFVESRSLSVCHRLHYSNTATKVSGWALPHVGRTRSLRPQPDWRQRHMPRTRRFSMPRRIGRTVCMFSVRAGARPCVNVGPWGRRRRACRSARGSRLALVVCERGGGYSALMQRPSHLSPGLTPNPSIEGTSSGMLRMPPAAPHVER